ncbi:MAG TPA: FAD-dependent monooxygenase [Terracidiphilus sp.]|nr:FAD-dependent monooxygenase [Terracidiphilus sp.]
MTGAPQSVENLVIGGGPAGAMAALRLAAARREVLLVEKEPAAHDKVCGEFLSHEAVAYLNQVGISPLDLGAKSIRDVRLSTGNQIVHSPLPFPALSLSRRVLDAALQARAEQTGCRVLRGTSVQSLAKSGQGWTASLSDGQPLHASAVFLAAGKHDLRGYARPSGKQSDLIGFKLHWRLAPAQTAALQDFMDLFLFPGGYGGLALIENDAANLCLVVRRSILRPLDGWPELLASILQGNRHLRRLLDDSTPLWSRPLAISPIPYGYLAQKSNGLWPLGDQAAVIPSFTGDGISIALHSAALATHMFLSGATANDYLRALRSQLTRSVTLATWLSRAAVTRLGRTCAPAALTVIPGAMRWVAASTRIPHASLVETDFQIRNAGPAAQLGI